MKNYVLILFLFLSSVGYSQTEQLETESLSERFKRGEFPPETYQKYASDWRKLIAELGGYPDLPYDERSGQIKFKIIHSTEQAKKVNYNRILEWSSINFGSINNVLHYKDFESGKIVIKGWFDVTHRDEYKNFWGRSKEGINTTKCYMTFIFTIIDASIKIEVLNVEYEFKSYTQFTPSTYNAGLTFEMSIHDIYPITNFDSDAWKGKLDLLNQTNIKIENLMTSLKNYVEGYDEDYDF